MIAPAEVKETVEAILRAFAANRKVEDPGTWVRTRKSWVERVLSRDPDLSSTPLMPILLAVSAASHTDHDELPSLRAAILRGVVRDVVDQWEASRTAAGALELGVLKGRRAVEALFGCFVVEGSTLAAESLPTEETALKVLSEYLQADWSLAPADTEATGREAIEFWDEAGFFLRESDGRLEARAKLFSEIADALHWVGASPTKLRDWVARTLPDADRGEALKLAAGLSPLASAALIEEAARVGELVPLETATAAITEGAEGSAALLEALCRALLGVVARGGDDGVSAAAALAELPVAPDLQRDALEQFARHLPPDHGLVAQVRANVHWGVERDPEVLRLFHEVLLIGSPKRIDPSPAKGGALELLGVDLRWGDAVAAATEALVSNSEEDAKLAGPLINKTGQRHSLRISAALSAAGYGALVREQTEEVTKAMTSAVNWGEKIRRSHEAEVAILEMIAALGEPRELSSREHRGLDELVDCLYTLEIPESPAKLLLEDVEEVVAGVAVGDHEAAEVLPQELLGRRLAAVRVDPVAGVERRGPQPQPLLGALQAPGCLIGMDDLSLAHRASLSACQGSARAALIRMIVASTAPTASGRCRRPRG
ncbi:MAG TPA: hypothetical protein VND98_12065 [Solirubrobacterales bacterium]|nr:hypothetical protein [Solirubrobacterales bacterium]